LETVCKTTNPKTRKGNQIMKNRSIQFRPTLGLLIPLVFAYFVLPSASQALLPPPDGGYPGQNTAEGQNALFNLTTGSANTAVGWFSLFSETEGSFNTAIGAGTLLFNVGRPSTGAGTQNTAIGTGALLFNTFGGFNTAVGAAALLNNTQGHFNTATGNSALLSNTMGGGNTATGDQALLSNTEGSGNTAVGSGALSSNTIGLSNTAIGAGALSYNTTGQNTAIGDSALYSNTQGTLNTAVGSVSLFLNSTGDQNTATGHQALTSNTTGESNTAMGFQTLLNNSTGNGNTAVGVSAGANVVTAANVTCIGSNAAGADVSNTTWITNVYGVTTQNGTTAPVIVSANGQLGTLASSERFKKDIATMEKASEAILSLRPVTFQYKSDAKGTPQFGLIAEEVAKVNPGLVLPDKEGKPYTVRYEAVNAMLLNEFLKEYRRNEEQEATIAQLKRDSAEQQKQIEVLTAGQQKVSAQLEASKPAPQVVNNP
jgi:trimeric autotransporter adhesin